MYTNKNKFRSNRVIQVNCAKNDFSITYVKMVVRVMYGVPLRFRIKKIFIIVMWLFLCFRN